MSAKRLSSYLNENLVDETLALELATRAGVEHKGTRLGTFLELLSWSLEDDRDVLEALMRKVRVRRKGVGLILARIADVMGRRPLSTVAELESLDRHINGKLDMWIALRSVVGDRVDGIDFDEMVDRAEGQARVVLTKLAAAS